MSARPAKPSPRACRNPPAEQSGRTRIRRSDDSIGEYRFEDNILFRSALPWLAAVVLLSSAGPAGAIDPFHVKGRRKLDQVNQKLAGQLLDFTHNHGCDRRLYCPSLGETRDAYVYLPPGYDGRTPFPAAIWMHGNGHDEEYFLEIVEVFDRAIRERHLPPLVIAAPDGSVSGHSALFNAGSFYLNSKAGNYEDYVAHDIWNFTKKYFAVRPERGAHVLAGASMGGFGAYNIGFKHREEFGQLVGIFAPLDLRYVDCHGRYRADYDPACVGERQVSRRQEVLARFYGVVPIRARRTLDPLVGRRSSNDERIAFMARESPREMLHRLDVRPGEFGMFVGYGTKDEFNIDAQCRHFLDDAAGRGIFPEVVVVEGGRHNAQTALAMFTPLTKWLSVQLAPYVPPGYDPAPIRCKTPALCADRRCPTLLGR
jgi:hypothetical protein